MKIGYRNILTESTVTVTASSESAGFEKQNAYDGRTGSYWRPLFAPAFLKAAGSMPLGMWMGDIVAGMLSPSELVTNGDMSSTANWTPFNSNVSIVSGALRVTSTGNGLTYVSQQIPATQGESVTLSVDVVTDGTTGGAFISTGSTPNGQQYGINFISNPTPGTYQHTFTPTTSVTYISFGTTSQTLSGEFMEWDNASVPSGGVNDLTVNNKDLSVYGSILKSEMASKTGIVEYSGFAGSNYLEQAYNATLEVGISDFFVGGWVRLKTPWPNTRQTLVHRSDGIGGGEFGLYINPNGTLRYASNVAPIDASGPKLNDGNYHFVAAVRFSQIIYLYVDGALVRSFVDSSNQLTTNATMRFGVKKSGLEALTDGYLSLWSVDNAGKSAQQIKDIYDKEKFYFIKGGTLPETFLSTRATTADYFAVYDHDLALVGSIIVLQYSDDDVTWSNVFDPIYPTTSSVIFKTFTQVSHKFWRVYVSGAGTRNIGVCMFGLRLDFKNGLTFGFSPPALGQQFVPRNNVSANGEFIGRSVTKMPVSGNLVFNPVFSQSWVRQFWPDLIRHMEKKPFVVLPEDPYPGEAIFCWTDRVRGPEYSSIFMSLNIPVKAKVS